MDELRSRIEAIGTEVVGCDAQCDGIERDVAAGILPRCLYLEERGAGRGAVVVGLNPGRADNTERQFHMDHGATYRAIDKYWRLYVLGKNRYYNRTQQSVDALGLEGPIWWTELAKCQSKPDVGVLSTQTLRYCGKRYLRRELESVPPDWVVIAVGRQAFDAIAYLLPDRIVIGCPHPTGSFGRWLLDGDVLGDEPAGIAAKCLDSTDPVAVWLTRAPSGRS